MAPKVSKPKKEEGRLAATMGVIQEVRELLKPENIRQVHKDLKKANSRVSRRREVSSSSDSSSGSDSDASHSSDCSTCSSASHSTDCSTCSHSTDCSTCSDSYSPLRNPRPTKRKTAACAASGKCAGTKSTSKKPAAKKKSTKEKENVPKKTATKVKASNYAAKSCPFATSTPKKAPTCCELGRTDWNVSKVSSCDQCNCGRSSSRKRSPTLPACCTMSKCSAASRSTLVLPSVAHQSKTPEHSRDRNGSSTRKTPSRPSHEPSSHREPSRSTAKPRSRSRQRGETAMGPKKHDTKRDEGQNQKKPSDRKGIKSEQRPLRRSSPHSNTRGFSGLHPGVATGLAQITPVLKKAIAAPATLDLQDALVAVTAGKVIYDGVMQSWSGKK